MAFEYFKNFNDIGALIQQAVDSYFFHYLLY